MTGDSKAVQSAKKMSLEPISSNTLIAVKARNCPIHVLLVNVLRENTKAKRNFNESYAQNSYF
jgi:hypothetical protein